MRKFHFHSIMLSAFQYFSDDSSYFSITDSVAQTITLTSFAFFLTSWLNSASGTSANDLQFVPNSSDIEPWFQHPCGTRLAASRRMHNSNDSNNIMKRVRTQLRVAQNHFNKTFKDVRIVYSKVRDESAPLATAIP